MAKAFSKEFSRKQLMSLNINTLRLVGLWRDDFITFKYTWIKMIYNTYGWVLCFVLFVNLISQLMDIFLTRGNVKDMAENGCKTLTYAAAVAKQFIFLVNHKKIVNLVQALHTGCLFSSLKWSENQDGMLHRAHLHCCFVSWSYYCFGIVTILLIDLTALTKSFPEAFPFLEGTPRNQTVKFLPFKAWYPFNVQAALNYEIVCVFQIMMGMFGPTVNIGIDTFIVSLIICCCGHFHVLKYSLRAISDRARELTKSDVLSVEKNFKESVLLEKNRETGLSPSVAVADNEPISCSEETDKDYICLIQCIHHHQALLKLVADMEEVLSPCLFAQFLSSSCTICLLLFLFAVSIDSDGVVAQLSSVQFLGISFLQLLLFCWYGQQLVYQSDSLTKALYDCPWYDASKRYRRSLYIMMARTIKLCYLTGGKLYVVSLETFRAILTASFSYYTVLRNLNVD